MAKPNITFELAIENIDIGGPSMLRSAAKNHAFVSVVVDAADYDRVLIAMDDEAATQKLRCELAFKVFQRISAYDGAIAAYLQEQVTDEPKQGDILGSLQNLRWIFLKYNVFATARTHTKKRRFMAVSLIASCSYKVRN